MGASINLFGWSDSAWADGSWAEEAWSGGEGEGEPPPPVITAALVGSGGGDRRPQKKIWAEHDGRNYFFNSRDEAEAFLAAMARDAEIAVERAATLIQKSKTEPRKIARAQKAKVRAENLVASFASIDVRNNSELRQEVSRNIERLDQIIADALYSLNEEEEAVIISLYG